MAPPNSAIASQLRQLIYYHLDHELLQNALFLAGRLHALEPRSAEAAQLLALCHLKMGQSKAAYHYAKEKGHRGQHLGCAYVFAQACLRTGRYIDGAGALERSRGQWTGKNNWNKHSETARRHLPDAAAANCLLGKLWRAQGDDRKAVQSYVEALKLNPFMWDAFLDLCHMGAMIRPSNIFKMSLELMPQNAYGSNTSQVDDYNVGTVPLQTQVNNSQVMVQNSVNDPFSSSTRSATVGLNAGGPNLMSKLNGSHHPGALTPTGNEAANEGDMLMYESKGPIGYSGITEPPQAPLRKTRTAQPYMTDAALELPRLKSALSKTRLKSTTSDSTDSSEGVRQFQTGPLVVNHKRTISGHTFQRAAERMASVAQDLTAVPQRQSARLLNQSRSSSGRFGVAGGLGAKEGRELKRAKATGTKGRAANASTVGRMVSGNRKRLENTEKDLKDLKDYRPSLLSGERNAPVSKQPAASETVQQQEALQWLLDLFASLGNGYFLLSRYQSQAALQAFASVPQQQRESPWTLSQIGKAYFERSAYVEAEEIFARIKKIAPTQMEDMEIYSTVLWHLKNEVELAYLSHELVEADRLSPQAWCAIGNSFSLQREHDQAIKCFRRATQLDPQFAYAFTLQGHEHVANEEFDKALLAYRHAIAADKRHYNGWYGLGRVYEKMGKLEIAEKHFRCAAQINPANAVLMVCIGVVLEKLRKTGAALVQYSHACDVDPRSALSRFKKARALMSLRHPREALAELLILKDMAPDEANVHFMLGRLYKMLRDKTSAIRHFTIALNLDPKAAQHIKEAMEYLEDDDDDDEDDDYEDEEMA